MQGLTRVSIATSGLALLVIVLGAYVRLSDAGLSCPDWPGCYGQIVVPSGEFEVAIAEREFPSVPVEAAKAWKEMTHRYLAGILGLAIAAIAILTLRHRHAPNVPKLLPALLVALVIFQALLGMWTVTSLLKPIVVTAHLLGGLLTVSLLVWLSLRYLARSRNWQRGIAPPGLNGCLFIGISALAIQLGLGGWTSANYAALACPDFPLCNGSVWPAMDISEGFQLNRELGQTLAGQLISHDGLVSIHFLHRLGALVTLVTLGTAGVLGVRQSAGVVRAAASLMLLLIVVQIALGASVVVNARPLGFAVLHNANATLLLLSVLTLSFVSRYRVTTLIESRLPSAGV